MTEAIDAKKVEGKWHVHEKQAQDEDCSHHIHVCASSVLPTSLPPFLIF